MFLDNYQNLLSNFCFLCLFLSMIFYLTSLIFPKFKIGCQIGKSTAILANLTLFLLLSGRWISHSYFPLSNLYESLLFLSWTLLFIQLILEYKTSSKIFGPIIIPIVLLINGFSNLSLPIEMQKATPLVPALQSNWLMMHVSLMLLSYATLITGSLLSILFILLSLKQSLLKNENQIYLIKKNLLSLKINNKNSILITSKFLENMDNLSYRIISLGFPFLTIGIISGAIWANEAWGSYWSWDPKETWALITWLIFAAYLHARIIKGWEGIKPSILSTIGFFMIWICYLGVNFLGQGLHSYGWMT
jgi:cytochrome c-type biogenesis protein CcsB|uniref:Cytochrome c biogenesis protein CcsA n=1 Tax=Vaucheria litorea TaxID=109269 RepID=B7T1Z9_VAULI|nr:cytochrome c biogenesis protein [Vaucheria litorea]ACF70965.1 protein involved in cytochrome c biogenesis [Vaucheria litorea]